MRAIARDEARHAALAFAIRRWMNARLTPRERARIDTAATRAISDLAPTAEPLRSLLSASVDGGSRAA
jgi:hypothetical protein